MHYSNAGKDDQGPCLYVFGVPGTGKTATVREVMRGLRARADAGKLPGFRFVEVNALRLPSPHHVYVQLYRVSPGTRFCRNSSQHAFVRFYRAGPLASHAQCIHPSHTSSRTPCQHLELCRLLAGGNVQYSDKGCCNEAATPAASWVMLRIRMHMHLHACGTLLLRPAQPNASCYQPRVSKEQLPAGQALTGRHASPATALEHLERLYGSSAGGPGAKAGRGGAAAGATQLTVLLVDELDLLITKTQQAGPPKPMQLLLCIAVETCQALSMIIPCTAGRWAMQPASKFSTFQ